MNKCDTDVSREHLQKTVDNSLGILLSGRIKDGKLELDEKTQEEIKRKFPDADKAFVAMNSPFSHVSTN